MYKTFVMPTNNFFKCLCIQFVVYETTNVTSHDGSDANVDSRGINISLSC